MIKENKLINEIITSAQLSSRRTSYRLDSEKNWEAATKPWHGYAPSS